MLRSYLTRRSASIASRSNPTLTLRASAFSSSPRTHNHSSDTYAKDHDPNPPDHPKTHRVDAGAERSQRPHEPPTGEWSRAGAQTKEYDSVSQEEPYAPPEGGKGKDTGYGGVHKGKQGERGEGTSHGGEGPTGGNADGRKPE